MNDEQLILSTLDAYQTAFSEKSVEKMMAVFTEKGALGGIGTGEDEYLFGRDAARQLFDRNFSADVDVNFQWGERFLEVIGECAWVQAKAQVSGSENGVAFSAPLRWTIVLAFEEGNWKWLHRHVSVATPSQEQGTAYPGKMSLFFVFRNMIHGN